MNMKIEIHEEAIQLETSIEWLQQAIHHVAWQFQYVSVVLLSCSHHLSV